MGSDDRGSALSLHFRGFLIGPIFSAGVGVVIAVVVTFV
jgi:hypothetical protein